nr:MAG TPA: hypothetical protein [Caudoviricetes sp.]
MCFSVAWRGKNLQTHLPPKTLLTGILTKKNNRSSQKFPHQVSPGGGCELHHRYSQ